MQPELPHATAIVTSKLDCHMQPGLLLATWIAKRRLGKIAQAPVPTMAIESPYRCFERVRWLFANSALRHASSGESNPGKPQKSQELPVQSALFGRANQPHSNRHPQPVHKARPMIRSKPFDGKRNLSLTNWMHFQGGPTIYL